MQIPIPQYQRGVAPSSLGVGPQWRQQASGVEDLAQGLGQLSNVLQRNDAERVENERREAAEQKKARNVERASNAHLEWATKLQELQTAAGPGAEGFTVNTVKEFDTYRKQQTEAIQDEAERRQFDAMLGNLREHVGLKSVAFEGGQRRAYRKQVVTDGADTDAKTVMVDPSQFQDRLAHRLAVIGSSTDLPAEDKAILGKQARELMSVSAATTIIRKDPAGWLARDPATDPVKRAMDPAQLIRMDDHARTEMSRGKEGAKTGLIAQEKDYQAMVLAGVAPPPGSEPKASDYAIFGADGERRYRSEVQTYKEIGDGLQRMKVSSQGERRVLVFSAAPDPGKPDFAEQQRVHQAMLQANAQIEKRLREDPAVYAAESSPRVQEAAAVMQQYLSDPTTDEAMKRKVLDSYAVVQNAEQSRLGAPKPQLLSDDQARGIAAQFYDQKQGGKNAAELVNDLEQSWGRWWPQVYGQLAKDEKLPPSALVIPNMKDQGARTRLAEWSTMKPADRDALITPADKKDINEAVVSQFQGAAGSFLAQGGGGQKTVSTVINQAEILAQGYRSQGKSVGDASKQAFDEVMGWKYDFTDTYRIPKDQKPDQVQQGATEFVRSISNVMALTGSPAVSLEAAKAQTLDAIKTHGMWITNGDETGLLLMLKGQDGGVYPVLNGEGKQIEMSWGALRGAAMTANTERALKRPKLPDIKPMAR